MELYLAALTLGFVTGFHCIGMCGPIALALPLKNKGLGSKIWSTILYNLGRTVTYTILGAIAGLIGYGFKAAGFQQWASIIIGLVMIFSVLFPAVFRKTKVYQYFSVRIFNRLKNLLSPLFSNSSGLSLFTIGLLNGLLPCGPVYYAIGLSIIAGSFMNGIIYMALFGIGTIPIMTALILLGNTLSVRFRNQVRKVIPVFIVCLGMLFVLRGMNLGIPYVSPKTEKLQVKERVLERGERPCCH